MLTGMCGPNSKSRKWTLKIAWKIYPYRFFSRNYTLTEFYFLYTHSMLLYSCTKIQVFTNDNLTGWKLSFWQISVDFMASHNSPRVPALIYSMLVMNKLKLSFHLLWLEEAKNLGKQYQIQLRPVFVSIRDTDIDCHCIVLIMHFNQCLLREPPIGGHQSRIPCENLDRSRIPWAI